MEVLPDAYDTYERAFSVVSAKQRWVMCPESHTNQLRWLDALRPMIGGDDAAAEARVGVFQRGGSFTSIQTEPKVLKAGWLRRASEADAEEGEHAEWCTRYFRLVSWWRDGAQQAELEYYLDAELTPDEDADTVELHPSSRAEVVEGERGREHVLQLTASDATCLLSADTAEELRAWVALLGDGWVEAASEEAGGGAGGGEGGGGGAGLGERMGRMLSLRPQSKAARDALSLGRTATLGLGRTATLGFGRTRTATRGSTTTGAKAEPSARTRSLVPGRKATATPPTAAAHQQDASQGGCSLIEEEEEEEEEEEVAAVLYSGYMAKKGDGFAAGWKQKWLVLHADGGLTYAESEGRPPAGRIELAGARKQDLRRSQLSLTLTLTLTLTPTLALNPTLALSLSLSLSRTYSAARVARRATTPSRSRRSR